MVGTAIAAAASAAASIGAGIAKTAAARRQQRALQQEMDSQKAKNDAWYMRRYNEDFLQRSENQRMLEQARQQLMKSSRAAAGTAAVHGTSNAVAAAQKEANNKAYADIAANVAANADATKDKVEQQYLSRDAQLSNKQMAIDQAKYDAQQAAIDTAAAGVQGVANTYMAAHTPADAAGGNTEDDSSLTASNEKITLPDVNPYKSVAEANNQRGNDYAKRFTDKYDAYTGDMNKRILRNILFGS